MNESEIILTLHAAEIIEIILSVIRSGFNTFVVFMYFLSIVSVTHMQQSCYAGPYLPYISKQIKKFA